MSKTEHDATLNSCIFKIFHFDQSVSIFLISNGRGLSTQGALALLEQLDTYIRVDDSNVEDFHADDVNIQKASSSERIDSNPVEHCANVISLVPKSGRSCGHGRTQGRRKNAPQLCDGYSNNKYSLCSSIICTQMNLSCPTFTAGRTPTRNIVTIPSGPKFLHIVILGQILLWPGV